MFAAASAVVISATGCTDQRATLANQCGDKALEAVGLSKRSEATAVRSRVNQHWYFLTRYASIWLVVTCAATPGAISVPALEWPGGMSLSALQTTVGEPGEVATAYWFAPPDVELEQVSLRMAEETLAIAVPAQLRERTCRAAKPPFVVTACGALDVLEWRIPGGDAGDGIELIDVGAVFDGNSPTDTLSFAFFGARTEGRNLVLSLGARDLPSGEAQVAVREAYEVGTSAPLLELLDERATLVLA